MTPGITIIAAVTRDGAIGKDNDLLYHISADLKRFKSLTMGHPILMGRKTFLSFPNGPLPGRLNIVLSRDPGFSHPGIATAPSVGEAVSRYGRGHDVLYVIGGGQVYAEAMPLASRLELTVIDTERPDADTFFPEADPREWQTVEESETFTDPRSGVSYRFVSLSRVTLPDIAAEP